MGQVTNEINFAKFLSEVNPTSLYFTDLQLAAEIGKALLEKNRELDLLLRTTQEYAEEQLLRSQVIND